MRKVKVYNNPQTEDFALYEVLYIKKIRDGLPFQIEEISVSKDVTYNLERFIGEVTHVYEKGTLPVGTKKVFSVRALLGSGIKSSGQNGSKSHIPKMHEVEDYNLVDSFIKVNGKEIY
jgi:hypothetical protein